MADTFKVGDVVQLKSGSPKMTVTNPSNRFNQVETSWFAGAKHEHGSFPADTLQSPAEPAK